MIDVLFKGQSWELFDSITVNTTLDNLCGTFELATTLKASNPFDRGDLMEIKTKVDTGEPINLVKGYVEESKGSITNSSAMVTYSGRDLLGDLVDSSVPSEVALTEGGISLPELCAKVINGLGISASVINQVGTIEPFSKEEISAVGFGGQAGSFLQSFARKRHLFLNTDGKGNLVIFNPPESLGYKEKLTKESILSRDFSYSDVNRFNRIEVGSEDNFAQGESPDPDNAVDRRAVFTDPDVRKTRQLQVQAEESMTDAEIEGKAQEEVNIRRARAFNFSCTVPSHKYEKGKLIRVEDELSGVYGTLLIRAVAYTSSASGNTSRLTLCFPETYSGVGERVTARKSKIGVQPEQTNDEAPRFFRGTFADPGENYLVS